MNIYGNMGRSTHNETGGRLSGLLLNALPPSFGELWQLPCLVALRPPQVPIPGLEGIILPGLFQVVSTQLEQGRGK